MRKAPSCLCHLPAGHPSLVFNATTALCCSAQQILDLSKEWDGQGMSQRWEFPSHTNTQLHKCDTSSGSSATKPHRALCFPAFPFLPSHSITSLLLGGISPFFSYFPSFPIPLGHAVSPQVWEPTKHHEGRELLVQEPALAFGLAPLEFCPLGILAATKQKCEQGAPKKPNLGLFSIPFIQQFLLLRMWKEKFSAKGELNVFLLLRKKKTKKPKYLRHIFL